jgi:signal transduction histidine kinase
MNESSSASLESATPSRQRLFLLIVIRFAVCFLGLLYLNFAYAQTFSSIQPHYITLFTGCGVNLVYLIWLGYGGWYRVLSFTQIFIDLLLEGVLVYLTGGVLFSVFSFLFFATVLYTPVYTRPRNGLLSASFATVLLSAVSIVYFLSIEVGFTLPYVPLEYTGRFTQQLNVVLPYLASFGLSLHLVGYLAGHLVRRVGLQEFLTREILENMREGVGAVDTKGRLYLLNDIAREYLGAQKLELENPLNLEQLQPGNFWASVMNAIDEGTGGRWDAAIPHEKGGQKHLEITLSNEPVRLPGHLSQEEMYFLFLRDITPRIEAERQRRRAEKLETVSNLGASIAHEIRNPLSSIQGAIQKIQSDLDASENDLNQGNDQLLTIMSRETDRVNRIIDDFIDFSREDQIKRSDVQVQDLLETVTRMTELAFEDSEVDIQLELEDDLTIHVDRDKFKQVFYNLIRNGVEHCQENGTVLVRGRKEQRRTLHKKKRGAHSDHWTMGTAFEVMDDGPGIPEEDLDHIFEPFFSKTDDGTGLGLAITSQIVHRHDGNIQASSRSTGGTCVELWIPDESIPTTRDDQ